MIINLHITPNSSKNQIIGWIEDTNQKKTLKIKILAPPEDGKANTELIKFLSKQWGIPKSAMKIVSGLTSRQKSLRINNNFSDVATNITNRRTN